MFAGGPDSDTPESELTKAARTTWARLIKKVYEVDPLICPHCGGQMRFLTDIEDASVTERILGQIGKWCPSPPPRAPPAEQEWPKCSQIPIACIMEQKSNLGYQKIAIGEIKKGDQHPGYSF